MNQNEHDFLQILDDHLENRKSTIELNDEIKALAKAHAIESIMNYQCPDSKQNALAASVFYYRNRLNLIQQITTKLQEVKINYFFVKGTTIAKYYPVPALRTMGDSDIIVDNKQLACKALEEIGFHIETTGDKEWVVSKNKIIFEIHDQLVYEEQPYVDYFKNAFQYVEDHELDWNRHFIFLLIHIRKHIIHSGIGIRQFYDLAVLLKYHRDAFDLDWIFEELEKLQLSEFAAVCLQIIHRYFNIEISCINQSEAFIEEAMESILHNGVFGFYNVENIKNQSIEKINESDYQKSILKNMIGKIFPGYQEMCTKHYGSFIQGKPYLLPVAWIYRMIYCTFIENKWTSLYRKTMISKDHIEQRQEYLKKWGL